jgi:hypothetical protein
MHGLLQFVLLETPLSYFDLHGFSVQRMLTTLV